MNVSETQDALETAFLAAGLPEGSYEIDGDNVVPLFPDDPDVIVKTCPTRGDIEILVDDRGEQEIESDGAELEGPASAGESTPESEYSETADSGPVEGDFYGELNNAAIYGPEPDSFVDFLNQPATFLTGEMWGAKDRRNTQDGDWKAVTLPWGAWINGGEGDKNRAAWGLSRHPVGKNKEGPSIVLGSSIEGARKANAMDEMYALGLDIDSGAALNDVVDTIREKSLLALIYTSHSHGKSGLEIKRDEVMRKLGIGEDPNLPQVQEYLRMYSKSRYEESFINQVRIEDGKRQTKEGVKIILSTPPLDKFRIIFPLSAPVKLIDLAPTQAAALEVWEDKITGMAWEALGVHFDTSCTDPSRLFYTARHAKEAEWDCMILRGDPLKFDDVPVYKKHQYTKQRAKLNPFEMVGADLDDNKIPTAETPSGKNLNDWHRHAKDRFQMASLLEDMVPDKIRHAGGETQGHVHTECPFEHEHSKEGGTATMAIDALDSQSEYWTWFCHHDSCQGRHKLEFLEEALQQGWFEEEVLFDEDGMYILDPGEEEKKVQPYLDRAAELPRNPSAKVVVRLIAEALMDRITVPEVEELKASVMASTGLKARPLDKLWKQAEEQCLRVADKQREIEKANMEMPELLPLDAATPETINAAAANVKWSGKVVYRDGWFGKVEGFGADEKFYKTCRAFEPIHCADGAFGKSRRGNEIKIRYRHRTTRMGIVESTYSVGATYKDSGTILGRLAEEGLDFHPQADSGDVLTLLRSVRGRDAVLIEKPGWTDDKSAWVSPTGEVATEGDTTYILVERMRVSAVKAGTLDLWTENAAVALRGRNRKHFLPGFLSGGVGILADYLDTQMSPIVANEGDGNRGKTSSLLAGVSWIAITSVEGLTASLNATETAIEGLAVRATGAVLALDEEGVINRAAEDMQSLYLMMAGGVGRARGNTDASVRELNSWRTCFTISTEAGFVSRMERAQAERPDVQVKTGAVSRILSVNYNDSVVLDKSDPDDARELAAYSVLAGVKGKDTSVRAYGWAGVVFADALMAFGVVATNDMVNAYVEKWGKNRLGAQDRVVHTVALFATTAEIAKEAGLIPKDVDTDALLEELLDETLRQRVMHLDTDMQSMEKLKRAVVNAVNAGQIIPTGGEKLHGRTTLGYYKVESRRGGEYGITPDTDDELARRTYILPEDRLGQLGVIVDPKVMAERINADGGLVEPVASGRFADRLMHETTPSEGRMANIRITGQWVHGLEDGPASETDAPNG